MTQGPHGPLQVLGAVGNQLEAARHMRWTVRQPTTSQPALKAGTAWQVVSLSTAGTKTRHCKFVTTSGIEQELPSHARISECTDHC